MPKPTTPQSVREEQLHALPGKRFICWAGAYLNSKSKARMICSSGHTWEATVESLVNSKSGCPKCAKNRANETSTRLRLESIPGLTFLMWDCGYKNRYSLATIRCDKGHLSSVAARNLLRGGGCPICAGNSIKPKETYEHLINSSEKMSFVTWVSGYSNSRSRAEVKCCLGHTWVAAVDNLVRGTGCPTCAKHGFNRSKPGTLYALVSNCGGHIKIGISNVYEHRIKTLRRDTPFPFDVIMTHRCVDGSVVLELEAEFHRSFERSGFKGFDGATEWLKFDPKILELMRILGA